MPKTSSILAVLPRDALRQLLDRHELRATDARKTDSMVRALSRGLPAQKATWLTSLPVAALKLAVSALELTPEGKGKAALVTALDQEPLAKKAKPAAVKAATPAPAKAKPVKAKKAKPNPAQAEAIVEAPAKLAAKSPDKVVELHSPPKAPAKKASKSTPKLVETPAAEDELAEDKTPSAPSHMLSWSEAVALATKRGQSAATMIGQPLQEGSGPKVRCGKCRANLEVQDCQIHACDHSFIAKAGQKICAECMFERNNMSVDTFHERLVEDWQCPHCSTDVPRPSS